MEERRRLWNAVLNNKGVLRGSEAEDALIQKHFGSLRPKSFRADLSRGFSIDHEKSVSEMCREYGLPYDPAVWLRDRKGRSRENGLPTIAFVGETIRRADDFYNRLHTLYGSARAYHCARVGGLYSGNRTRFEYEDNNSGLALLPLSDSIRLPYLLLFWDRVRTGELRGESVHVVKTLDRLVELWASVEYLRSIDRLSENSVSLAPVARPDPARDLPSMGVRIIGTDKTLFSLPPRSQDGSRYSSWIASDVLAGFAIDYIARVTDVSRPLSNETPPGLRSVIQAAYAQLCPADPDKDPPSGNYGVLDTFEKLETIKNRMLDWSRLRQWLPVIA